MTYEFSRIVEQALVHQQEGQRCVLATLVDLEGTSYRQPGVQMLFAENGIQTGALSGGCIEQEVFRRAQSVFSTGVAKVIAYDGRYRLGCEGLLYILIEPVDFTVDFQTAYQKLIKKRIPFTISTSFKQGDEVKGAFGSRLNIDDSCSLAFSASNNLEADLPEVQIPFDPIFHLMIAGGEHDSLSLSNMGSQLGWEVTVIVSPRSGKNQADFPNANSVIASFPELFPVEKIDAHTAIVLMTHSFALDLKYLQRLINTQPAYLGVLGAISKREKLFDALLQSMPDLDDELLNRVKAPAGLNLGAIAPEEISLSILSEILAVIRKRDATALNTFKRGITIH